MSATRHKFSKCQHLGFGGFCHRCAQADVLEERSKALRATKQTPKEGKQVIGQDEAAKLMAEAERLRAPRVKN